MTETRKRFAFRWYVNPPELFGFGVSFLIADGCLVTLFFGPLTGLVNIPAFPWGKNAKG